MSLVLLWCAKTSAVLACGLLTVPLLRRASAATRHAVLTAAVLGACLMPALVWLVPEWPVLPSVFGIQNTSQLTWLDDPVANGSSNVVISSSDAPAPTGFGFADLGLALWGLCSAIVLARLGRSVWAVRALVRGATPLTNAQVPWLDQLRHAFGVRQHVQVLAHPTSSLVAVVGLLTPRLIVPAAASEWSTERWQVVLRHELAHLERRDLWWQWAAHVLTVLQPWNPLSWLSARRLRHESELACDDAVLASGISARVYAAHLLDVARQATRPSVVVTATAIANPSTLERRIHAMLQSHTRRRALTLAGWALTLGAALVISLPIAATSVAEPQSPSSAVPVRVAPATAPAPAAVPTPTSTPVAIPVRPVVVAPTPTPLPTRSTSQTASVTFRVVDQTGGVIPGANITLTRADGTATRGVTNAMGRVAFADLAAGPHEASIALPGFRTGRASLTLTSGQVIDSLVTLEVGGISETVTITCSEPSYFDSVIRLTQALVPSLHAQSGSTPVRVGGSIREPRKTRHVVPTCPAGAATPVVTFVVAARIDTTGKVVDAALQPGIEVSKEMADAALDAVRQWEFTPTQLNGQPVAISLAVTLKFTKS